MKICEICGTVEGALLEVVIGKNESHIYCKDCIAAGGDEIGQIAKVRPARKRSGAR